MLSICFSFHETNTACASVKPNSTELHSQLLQRQQRGECFTCSGKGLCGLIMKLKLLREGILTRIYAPMVIGHGLTESDASLIAYVFFFFSHHTKCGLTLQ